MVNDNLKEQIEQTRTKHEFLTFLIMKDGKVKCGVVQNETPKMIMFYDFEKIKSEEMKEQFIKLADEWWWESNQSIPIDSFIGERFDKFQPVLSGYPKKSLEHDPIGPSFSISDMYLKRIKKKRVDIVNKSNKTKR